MSEPVEAGNADRNNDTGSLGRGENDRVLQTYVGPHWERRGREEMEASREYDHVIVNDEISAAVEVFLEFVKNERRRLEIG